MCNKENNNNSDNKISAFFKKYNLSPSLKQNLVTKLNVKQDNDAPNKKELTPAATTNYVAKAFAIFKQQEEQAKHFGIPDILVPQSS